MAARLIQLHPPAEHILDGTGTVVGRGAAATIRLDEPSLSREHARILRQGDQWHILDLGSANGTLVNNMPLRGLSRLRHGDILRLGSLSFTFSSGEEDAISDETLSGATLLSMPETRQVVLLVADLKGFTPLSSRLGPAALAAAVRYWCEECQRILENHGARVDKFIGDCAFAWWSGHEAAVRVQALEAARGLLGIARPSEAVLECGVALHCGEAALCRMPDSSFTLLGSAVNTTFRMEALTRQLGHPILVSGAFASGWQDSRFRFTDCGLHSLKGLPQAVPVLALNRPLGDPEAEGAS